MDSVLGLMSSLSLSLSVSFFFVLLTFLILFERGEDDENEYYPNAILLPIFTSRSLFISGVVKNKCGIGLFRLDYRKSRGLSTARE